MYISKLKKKKKSLNYFNNLLNIKLILLIFLYICMDFPLTYEQIMLDNRLEIVKTPHVISPKQKNIQKNK